MPLKFTLYISFFSSQNANAKFKGIQAKISACIGAAIFICNLIIFDSEKWEKKVGLLLEHQSMLGTEKIKLFS